MQFHSSVNYMSAINEEHKIPRLHQACCKRRVRDEFLIKRKRNSVAKRFSHYTQRVSQLAMFNCWGSIYKNIPQKMKEGGVR